MDQGFASHHWRVTTRGAAAAFLGSDFILNIYSNDRCKSGSQLPHFVSCTCIGPFERVHCFTILGLCLVWSLGILTFRR